MENEFEKKVAEAIANPRNMGEMAEADAVGSVGSPGCGDMVRMWLKFKEENGRRVIDKASFQTFGCETAIAVASLATELVRGKTAEEALAFSGQDLAGGLGPLPPMKIHCGQLVEGALRSALAQGQEGTAEAAAPSEPGGSLLERFSPGGAAPAESGRKIVFLDSSSPAPGS